MLPSPERAIEAWFEMNTAGPNPCEEQELHGREYDLCVFADMNWLSPHEFGDFMRHLMTIPPEELFIGYFDRHDDGTIDRDDWNHAIAEFRERNPVIVNDCGEEFNFHDDAEWPGADEHVLTDTEVSLLLQDIHDFFHCDGTTAPSTTA